MTPDLEASILRQSADDAEYVETCREMQLALDEDWQIEARLRAETIPDFVIRKLSPDWPRMAIIARKEGGEELSLRREQPLTFEAVHKMSSSLMRLAHTYNLEWLNWSEFDGHIYRSLHRTPLAWSFEGPD